MHAGNLHLAVGLAEDILIRLAGTLFRKGNCGKADALAVGGIMKDSLYMAVLCENARAHEQHARYA